MIALSFYRFIDFVANKQTLRGENLVYNILKYSCTIHYITLVLKGLGYIIYLVFTAIFYVFFIQLLTLIFLLTAFDAAGQRRRRRRGHGRKRGS